MAAITSIFQPSGSVQQFRKAEGWTVPNESICGLAQQLEMEDQKD